MNAFPSLFLDVPSRTTVLEHDIDVGSATPIKQHAYRVNPQKRLLLQKEVDYLLEHDLAEPSFSAWSSPCLLVSKPDGTYRFCTDYRRLNSVTKPDCFPLPKVDDSVDYVGAAQFVSKFDLLKGYWQVPRQSRPKSCLPLLPLTPSCSTGSCHLGSGMPQLPFNGSSTMCCLI